MTKVAPKKAAKAEFTKETYLSWYEMMYRIRRFEERAQQSYAVDRNIRGFCHLYIGQEAIAAGMMSACRQEDPWITAYRQHGLALAKGLTSNECMAELWGKVGGNVKGKGGSMHFMSKEKCYFGGHGIVGGQIGLGTGIGFAEKYKGTDNVCVALFGDGAARQGILFETFNMAMTWKLPVIYICENNNYAMGTSVERTSNVTDIYKIGLAFDMPSFQVDGMQPETVHQAMEEALARARRGDGPTFLEIKTYRYRGHSMSDPQKYRTKEEVEEYKEKDPITVTERRILDYKFATEAELEAIRQSIEVEVEESIKFSENSPWPEASLLYEDNYAEPNYPFLT